MATWKADDGTKIHYETHGEGTGKSTLLLLPGLLGSISLQWRPFLEPLSETFRVVLPDLRGHGRSENNAPDLRPERMMQDLSGLLDHLRVNQVHITGYSLGGYLGMMLYLNQPRRVTSLLMHATKFYWTHESVMKMRQQMNPDIMAQKVPAYANQLFEEHGSRWRNLVRQAGDLIGLLSESGITDNMAKRVQIPVIVSVGDRDELVPLPEAARLSQRLPNGGLLVLPNTHHPLGTVQQIPLLPTMQAFHR